MKINKKYFFIFLVPLFYTYITLGYLWHFFTGKIWGIFFLSLLLYVSHSYIGLSKPYSPHELFMWISEVPSDFKIAIISSGLTILGFLIAFHTATLNWKRQMASDLKLRVAFELEEFFNEVSKQIRCISHHMDLLLKIIDKKDSSPEEVSFLIDHAIGKLDEFKNARDEIFSLSVEVHRLKSRYSLLLSTMWGAEIQYDLAVKSLEKIIDAIPTKIPYTQKETANYKEHFISNIDIDACRKFIDIYDDNDGKMAGLIGGLRGLLFAPITELNSSTIKLLFKQKKEFKEFLSSFKEKTK